jgi:hypothetical protein
MNAETKKLKARDEFVHYAEAFLDQKFGNLNSVQQSFALTHFYIKEIQNRVGSEISDEDLELDIVDASNDLGSGLIDHSQKMTSAAIQIADMNVWAHRS